MKKNLSIGLVMLGIAFIGAPAAFAETTTSTQANTSINTLTTVSAVIAKGDAMIAKRVDSLNKFNSRVASMKHLSTTDKATITASIQTSINAMNTLKAKLDADTDLATAKVDYQAIFKDNRIYAVVLPQERAIGTADAYATNIATIQDKVNKLQVRADAAHAAGKDTTAIQASIDDAKTKIADSATQSTTATNAAASLQVDHGDATIIATNKTNHATVKSALTAFHTDIKTARTDLKSANAALKALGM